MKKLLAVLVMVFSVQSYADLASDLADASVSLDQTVINAVAANETLEDIALALLNDGQSLDATTQALVSNTTVTPLAVSTALFSASNSASYTSTTVVSQTAVTASLQSANIAPQVADAAAGTGQSNALSNLATPAAGPVVVLDITVQEQAGLDGIVFPPATNTLKIGESGTDGILVDVGIIPDEDSAFL